MALNFIYMLNADVLKLTEALQNYSIKQRKKLFCILVYRLNILNCSEPVYYVFCFNKTV